MKKITEPTIQNQDWDSLYLQRALLKKEEKPMFERQENGDFKMNLKDTFFGRMVKKFWAWL
jgi:hypothetical protein